MQHLAEHFLLWCEEFTGDHWIDTRIYGMKQNNRSHLYYAFFHWYAKEFKPSVVVELGSWQGTSAACFAAGNPDGLVITVDHHTDPGDETNKALTQAAARRYSNLKYCQGWTCNEIYEEEKDKHALPGDNAFPKVLRLLDGKKIDLLFIDSWHVYKQARRDWDAYSPLLNSPAVVVVDDLLDGNPGDPIEGIDKFFQELPGEKVIDSKLHEGFPMGWTLIE